MITEKEVMDALKRCYDPEVGLSIVDLGLVYEISVKGGNVNLKMTLTTPGCPMHNVIAQDAYSKIEAIDGVKEVNVELVWNPPWSPARMSPEARKLLGFE